MPLINSNRKKLMQQRNNIEIAKVQNFIFTIVNIIASNV